MRQCPQCGVSYEDTVAFCPVDGTRTEAAASSGPDDSLLGRVIDGRYRVEQRIGIGGMGVVYRATHVVLKRPFALKVIRGEQAADSSIVHRFVREARAASAIGHPNIVNINDFGTTDDGAAYLAMEYLDGMTLAQAMQQGPIPLERALSIFVQIAGALEATHAQGIVHRDLKPENIFLMREAEQHEFVKVLDFGIAKVKHAAAKVTRTGLVFGTPHYMSPEQAAGQPVDQRSDIYSLGVIMYQVLAGQLPFTADSAMALITKHMFETPRSLREVGCAVPSALDAIVARCLQKKPELRQASMRELENDLRRVQVSPVSEPRPSAPLEPLSMAVAAPAPPSLVTSDTLEAASRAHVVESEEDERIELPKQRPSWLWFAALAALVGLLALSIRASTRSDGPSDVPMAVSDIPVEPAPAAAPTPDAGQPALEALPQGRSAPASFAPEPTPLTAAESSRPRETAAKPATVKRVVRPRANPRRAAKRTAQHGETLLDPWR